MGYQSRHFKFKIFRISVSWRFIAKTKQKSQIVNIEKVQFFNNICILHRFPAAFYFVHIWSFSSNISFLFKVLYLMIRDLFGRTFSNNVDPVIAKVSIGGSSLDERELIALAGNDTVTSPLTLCLK